MAYRYRTIAGALGLMGVAGCAVTAVGVPGDEEPTPTPPVTYIGYLQDGRVAVASTAKLVVFDSHLGDVVADMSFILPPEAHPWYAEVAANGQVAQVTWSTLPPQANLGGAAPPPVFVDVRRVIDGSSLQRLTLPYQTGAVVLSPAGDLVVAYSGHDDGSGITAYSVSDGAQLWSNRIVASPLVFAPDGHTLYVGGPGHAFQSFDAYTGEPGVSGAGTAGSISVAPDGAHLVGGTDASVNVWRTSDGSLERTVTQVANFRMFPAVATSGDGQLATVGSPIVDSGAGFSLQVWNDTGELRYHVPFTSQTFLNYWLEFSPTGEELLVGTNSEGGDVAITLFRVSDGKPAAVRNDLRAAVR